MQARCWRLWARPSSPRTSRAAFSIGTVPRASPRRRAPCGGRVCARHRSLGPAAAPRPDPGPHRRPPRASRDSSTAVTVSASLVTAPDTGGPRGQRVGGLFHPAPPARFSWSVGLVARRAPAAEPPSRPSARPRPGATGPGPHGSPRGCAGLTLSSQVVIVYCCPRAVALIFDLATQVHE